VVIAIAALVGLFSEQATLKLRDIANAILTKPGEGKDSKPQESLPPTGGKGPKPDAGAAEPKISPDKGPSGGGTPVTISGIKLSSVKKVTFGGADAPDPNFDSATSTLKVTTPKHDEGEVDVIITDSDGKSLKLKFTYE
jgi:hypothetical protein